VVFDLLKITGLCGSGSAVRQTGSKSKKQACGSRPSEARTGHTHFWWDWWCGSAAEHDVLTSRIEPETASGIGHHLQGQGPLEPIVGGGFDCK
jgi:hypothetical protein